MKQSMACESLVLSASRLRARRAAELMGRGALLSIASVAAIAVLFIFVYIIGDALPFFRTRGLLEFFAGTHWYPSREPAEFGALAIFVGSGLVALGAAIFAVPLGVAAAVCLSDVLPFGARQLIKPVIEILAAIPSVAYGFFALVVFAPLLQARGGAALSAAWWAIAAPVLLIASVIAGDLAASALPTRGGSNAVPRACLTAVFCVIAAGIAWKSAAFLEALEISSGANALNASIILGIMALPTVISVSEDALQAVGRELREGSYALGATRAETMVKTVIPAAGSGILAATLLGVMRALGETMVVWMASGNAAQIPKPWFNFLRPVRTLTATIAGDMGEADHVTGSARYHVLFAMGLCLLAFCFLCNLAGEWVVSRQRKRLGGG